MLFVLTASAQPTAAEPEPERIMVPDARVIQREPVSEAAKRRAEAAYERVQEHFGAAKLEDALLAADEAYEAKPGADTSLIRAFLLGAQQRSCEALIAMLTAASGDPTDEELDRIEAGLAEHGAACAPSMGWVRVPPSPGAGVVRLSGVEVMPGSLVGAAAGEHELTYEPAEGVSPPAHRAAITVRAGQATHRVTWTPVAAPPPPSAKRTTAAATATPPRTTSPISTVRAPDSVSDPTIGETASSGGTGPWLGWTLVGSGAAIALGGLGLHIWALDAASERDQWLRPREDMGVAARRERFDSAHETAKNRMTGAWVLYGVGAAATITGVVFLLLDDDDPREVGAATPRWFPSFAPAAGGGALGWSGTW